MNKKVYINEKKRTCAVVLNCDEGQFVGVAKCSPVDKWDETAGIALAKKRAFAKIKRVDIKEFLDNAEFFHQMEMRERRKADKAQKRLKEIEQEIKEMSK